MVRPSANAPSMMGWAARTLREGSKRAERLADRFAPTSTSHASHSTGAVGHTISPPTFGRATQTALDDRRGRQVSIVAVRIDHFDVVTAGHGIGVGLEVLAVAATRLREAVRSHDPLTRFGSDGFMLLWSPDRPTPTAIELAERIAAQFDRPIGTSAGQLPITVSTGIATAGEAPTDAATLENQAQTAVTTAHRGGRAQLVVFDQAWQARAIESYETERHLRAAVRNDELSVHYQPIVSLHSGAVVGVEALARWTDDTLGCVSPATFIPIAEDSGLIGELGQLVMRAAVEQGGDWNRSIDSDVLLMINLSNRQLLDPNLIPAIASLLDEHDLAPGRVCLEITESVVMNNVAASMTILGHMKDLGLCLAIDDFGTGYSSLSYLRRLPVDILKIDRSFVQSVYNRDDRVITKAVIDLAHTLGMTTIAEGVETQLQAEVLHALNCDMAQGFLLHRPTPAHQVDFTSINFEQYPQEIGATSLVSESHDLQSARAAPMGPSARQ